MGLSRRLVAVIAALAAVVVSTPAQAASPKTLSKFIAASGLSGSVSVSVVRLNGTPVYEWKGTKTRIPASNEKLVTAVAALSELGASARVHTAVAAVGEPSGSGVIHGSLYLVGGGDPTLSSADITRLARSVKASGVRRVTGSIVGDETLWDARRDAPGWKSGFLGEECPPLSALTLARNKAGRSATRAAAALLRALRKAGVKVNGVVRAGRAPAGAAPIALDASPRIDTMLRTMGKKSDNFTAEMLLKAVGASAYGRGTTAGGAKRARQATRDLGVSLTGSRVVDGSGLSGKRSHHDGPAGTAARGRVADAVHRRAAPQVAGDRGPRRHAVQPHDDRPGPRRRPREDGHAQHQLGAVGLRRAVRVQRDRERRRREPLDGARAAGPHRAVPGARGLSTLKQLPGLPMVYLGPLHRPHSSMGRAGMHREPETRKR